MNSSSLLDALMSGRSGECWIRLGNGMTIRESHVRMLQSAKVPIKLIALNDVPKSLTKGKAYESLDYHSRELSQSYGLMVNISDDHDLAVACVISDEKSNPNLRLDFDDLVAKVKVLVDEAELKDIGHLDELVVRHGTVDTSSFEIGDLVTWAEGMWHGGLQRASIMRITALGRDDPATQRTLDHLAVEFCTGAQQLIHFDCVVAGRDEARDLVFKPAELARLVKYVPGQLKIVS